MRAARGVPTREPLLNRAAITSIVGLLIALLAVVGVRVTSEVSEQLVDVLLIVLPTLGPLVTGWLARPHVTPLASPQDATGRPLIALVPVPPD